MSRTIRNHIPIKHLICDERFGKDTKPGCSPTSKFKRLKSRIRRAKAKQNPDIIFKKSDSWDWN